MKKAKTIKLVSILALSLALAACKSAEERAEEKFQSGLALLESGDPDRAIVEFRNVFELNGFHKEARWELANIYVDRGDSRRAYRQLLRLVEQYPDDVESRVLLSELAFSLRDWDEVDRHGGKAAELAPNDPRVEIVTIGRDYRDAVAEDDATKRASLAIKAAGQLESASDSRILRNLLIDHNTRVGQLDVALENIDFMIEETPADKILQEQRLAIIAQSRDPQAIEDQLLNMIDLFPEDNDLKGTLLRFHLANNEADKAEAFLRKISSPSDEDPSAFLDLIRFVSETKGDEAALIEIERAIAENPNPESFRALRASLAFAKGDQDSAIAEMEDVIAGAEPSEELNGIKVTLARMFQTQDNEVGARRLIEEVLAEDQLNGPALKMRAAWQIESDEVTLAISDLRAALDADPEDNEAMTLMAQAYTRSGNHGLARDFLALAVEASNNSPEESIRYANVLMSDEQYLPAEDVLIPALRLSPGNVDILQVLGRLYILLEDEPRAQQVIETLRNVGTPQAIAAANSTEAELLNQTDGTEKALEFLESVAANSDGDLSAQLFLLRGRLASGDVEGARGLLDTMLQETPDSLALQSVAATISAVAGDYPGAESQFRELLAKDPTISRNWLELSRLLMHQRKLDEARAVVDEGLETLPDDPNLLWVRASYLEQDGDIDGAIGVYEALYENTSGAPVVANNLASLLATYRNDEESLERAFVIARRLQGTEVPQFQDTIGWILHRRGDHEEALTYLEPAAAALADDAMTQFHLGMVQAALENSAVAIEQLQKALDLAGPDDTREQFQVARDTIAELQAQ